VAEGVRLHINTFGLEDKFALFTDVQAKAAMRGAMTRIGTRGKALVKAKTPVKSGQSRAGIRSKSRGVAGTYAALIWPSGPHAHVTKWQDLGTGPRHKRKNGQYTGMVEPQYMFERSAGELEASAPGIVDDAISKAISRSGLG